MKIGFAGAHSNGKTSQLYRLAQTLNLTALSEVVRTVAAEWGIPNVAEVPERDRFQWEVLRRQMAQENAAGYFVSDRTTVDNAAYFLRYVAPEMNTMDVERYIATARAHAENHYDAIIYFPIMWDKVEDDGFRGTDPGERREIDDLIRQLLTEWQLWNKVIVVTKDDHRDGEGARVGEILSKLGAKASA